MVVKGEVGGRAFIVMEITLLIMENHGIVFFEFLWEALLSPMYRWRLLEFLFHIEFCLKRIFFISDPSKSEVVVRPWQDCLGNNKVQWKAIAVTGIYFIV